MSIDARPGARSDSAARKFLFDQVFEDGADIDAAEQLKKPVYSEEQMEALRKNAYDSGYAAGQKSTADERERRTQALIGHIEQNIGKLFDSVARLWDSQNHGMQDVALAIARRILPSYTAKHGLAEIEATLGEVISAMAREPRLVVRVGDEHFDSLSERMKAITDSKAYAGKVVILADSSLGAADCRIEWADGGIERRDDALWHTIERIVGGTDGDRSASQTKETGDLV